MSVVINRQLIEQTSFDSSSPNGLGVVIHQFEAAGEYSISFVRGDQQIEQALLSVAEQAGQNSAAPLNVHIDLEQIPQRGRSRLASELEWKVDDQQERQFKLRPGGYAIFTTANRTDGYAIAGEQIDIRDKTEPFDSRRLGAADLFAVTLLRPGTYAVTNTLTGAQGKIAVAYPSVGKEPYRPPEPITVECNETSLRPDSIELQPAQGIIFRFSTPSNIKIELVEPNNGPAGLRQRKIARWRKPRIERPASDSESTERANQ